MKKIIITATVFLIGFAACKRGTDPAALQGLPAADQTTNLPSDITFAADVPDTTNAAVSTADNAATTTAVPEAVAKERLAAQQEEAAKKTNVPPTGGVAKNKSTAKLKKTDPVPAKMSAVQEKWCGIVGERSSLSVGNAVARMTNNKDKARGIYALYAVSRYLALGNQDAAESEWIKFQQERNGPHSALLNSLFIASQSCDHGFSTFVQGHDKPAKKKKKKG